MMRCISFLLVFVVVGMGNLKAQAPTKAENALLWRIDSEHMRAPSYLFGTIHMIGKDDFFLTDAVMEHFGESQKVVFEIDLQEMSDMGALMPLLMQAFMKGDTSLQDLLEPDEYELVSRHFDDLGLPMMFLDRIKPMFLSAMTSEDMFSMDGSGNSDIVSYEMEFMKMAEAQDKPMAGLETAAYQMSMFDSIPYRDQAYMLLDGIKGGDSEDDQLQDLVELYKKEDLQGLQNMLQSDEEGLSKYQDLLLDQRNRNWIPVMESTMQQQPTFFAVGAGHLAGELGVIALLRAAGYEVTPVK